MLQAVITAASAIVRKQREAVVERINHSLAQVVVRGRGGALCLYHHQICSAISKKQSINKMREKKIKSNLK